MNKFSKYLFWSCLLIYVLAGLVFSETVKAEVRIGGKIETNLIGTLNGDNEFTSALQEHLQLKLMIPPFRNTTAKFELNLYYQPQGVEGLPNLTGDLSKLYIKQRFEKYHLTIGRQPISWSFGSLLNPVDFGPGQGILNNLLPEKSENAILGYFPLGVTSSLTAVCAFPELNTNPKLGFRGRTDFYGYDLTVNYVRSPEQQGGILPRSEQIGFTAKGDLGPLGVYTALGYHYGEAGFDQGWPVFLTGLDYSFHLDYGGKILTQLEYLHDQARENQLIPEESDLVIGLIGYEYDEFTSLGLTVALNPQDQSWLLVPAYKNMLSSGLDFSIRGALFLGEANTEFAPREIEGEVIIPRGMLQIGFSYPF